MAGLRLNNMVIFMVIAIAALQMQSSNAQTTHTVADVLGWNILPGGAAAYSTWASTQNFTVGDVLVFNFTTNFHDVAEVTQAAFDGCNVSSPISLSNTGPTNITLTSARPHYYICTFGGHCLAGQKLAINVSAASTPPPAPAPQPPTSSPPSPTTPTPTPTPTPPAPTTPTPTPTPTPAAPAPAPTPTPSSHTTTPTPSPTATPPPSPTPPSTPPPAGGETSPPPPPPSGSAATFAVAALPVTFLSVAIAFLY